MSETNVPYRITTTDDILASRVIVYGKPQGEICLRYDEPEADEVTDDEQRELFLAQLDGWIRGLNIAIKEIEPFISQKKQAKASMHGMKVVFPCCTKFYKVLTEMQKSLYNLRKDEYR
jgi:hypothetical protein